MYAINYSALYSILTKTLTAALVSHTDAERLRTPCLSETTR